MLPIPSSHLPRHPLVPLAHDPRFPVCLVAAGRCLSLRMLAQRLAGFIRAWHGSWPRCANAACFRAWLPGSRISWGCVVAWPRVRRSRCSRRHCRLEVVDEFTLIDTAKQWRVFGELAQPPHSPHRATTSVLVSVVTGYGFGMRQWCLDGIDEAAHYDVTVEDALGRVVE